MLPIRFRTSLLALAAVVLVAGCSASKRRSAFGPGENLAFPVPAGYVQVFHETKGKLDHRELVPRGESATDWTEMLTVQIFRGGVDQETPEAFVDWLSASWKEACPGSETGRIDAGRTKGYPWTYWFMDCEKSPRTGKREYTRAMAFAGRDSFYLVQKVWSREPAPEEIVRWDEDFFSYLHVCDTRSTDARCPDGGGK